MDLFRNYPPVHDVSVIVHGAAALDAQCYLNEMWLCNSDLLKKEYFDVKSMSWQIGSELQGKPEDPLQDPVVMMSVTEQQKYLLQLHEDIDNQCGAKGDDYSKIEEYKRADRILSVGKYWTGPNMNTDYHHGSEIMKEHLIKNARYMIRISQQDLISAWKKRWVDHTVCRWLIEALLANKSLQLHVVVSPLDAAAGAAGDQYSFGSGAERTFELLKYYITHDLDTDELLSDENGDRADALKRVLIAPFFFTDRLSEQQTTEGKTYQWPNLDLAAYTATLKQQPLAKKPPLRGIIGSSLMSTIEGSGFIYPKVPAAPANHAKLMIIDDELYVVGSDNLYPGHLSEFNYVVEGKKAVEELIAEYWQQVWKYSSPHVFPKLNQDLYCSSGNGILLVIFSTH